MEKRVFLALFLSFLVLYGYQAFFVKPGPSRPAPGAKPTQPAAPVAPTTTTSAQVQQPASTPAEPRPVEAEPAAAPLVGETKERDVRVETPLVEATFTTRGAVLKSWRLKNFRDARGQPMELVPQAADRSEWPFQLYADDPSITKKLSEAIFRPSSDSVDATRDAGSPLIFEYEDQSGLRVVKTFQFDRNSYVVSLAVTATAGGGPINPRISMGAGVGDPSGYYPARGLFFSQGDVTRLSVSDIAKQTTHQGDMRFAGVEDQYFVSSAIMPGTATVEYAPVGIATPGAAPDTPAREFISYRVRPASASAPLRFYIGPKEFDALSAIDRDFVRAIDFGIFAFLVVPLLRSLKWINGFVGNYGWSIVLLTIFINALMFPLRHKSVVSMRKMQEIQPQVKAIQDRYGKMKATDPERQKMNTELMNLYREKGVNPASGCVPMLLTIPVMFALYSLLAGAIEIRGEPFIWWIRDLSAPDPYYITPVLMTVTMFIQQKMTPSTADPVQQKMMLMMPLVMGVMFLNFSSGLVLYWLVSNLWAIGQQWVTNQIIGPPIVHAPRPPAERRVKASGNK